VNALHRLAVAHPFLTSIGMAAVLFVWTVTVSGISPRVAFVFSAAVGILNAIVRVPRHGPVWKYARREIAEFDAYPHGVGGDA